MYINNEITRRCLSSLSSLPAETTKLASTGSIWLPLAPWLARTGPKTPWLARFGCSVRSWAPCWLDLAARKAWPCAAKRRFRCTGAVFRRCRPGCFDLGALRAPGRPGCFDLGAMRAPGRPGWLVLAAQRAPGGPGWLGLAVQCAPGRPGWFDLAELRAPGRPGWLDLAALCAPGRPGWVDLGASECPNDCPNDAISKKNRFAYRRPCLDAACFVRSGTFLHASNLV